VCLILFDFPFVDEKVWAYSKHLLEVLLSEVSVVRMLYHLAQLGQSHLPSTLSSVFQQV
jgi:hypothetical protein